eukprot:scaffold1298_cov382-Prasinococcus_capsulatus_cf.AAC.5
MSKSRAFTKCPEVGAFHLPRANCGQEKSCSSIQARTALRSQIRTPDGHEAVTWSLFGSGSPTRSTLEPLSYSAPGRPAGSLHQSLPACRCRRPGLPGEGRTGLSHS